MGQRMLGLRVVLASLGSLAAPAVVRGQGARTLRFVPRTGLALLDPVWTTETATRAFALSVFESLYSVDEKWSRIHKWRQATPLRKTVSAGLFACETACASMMANPCWR